MRGVRGARLRTSSGDPPVVARRSIGGWLLAVLARRMRARGVCVVRRGIGWLIGGGSGGWSTIDRSSFGSGSCLEEPTGWCWSSPDGLALPGGWSQPSELARLWGGAPPIRGAIPGSPGIVAGSQVISRKVCGT